MRLATIFSDVWLIIGFILDAGTTQELIKTVEKRGLEKTTVRPKGDPTALVSRWAGVVSARAPGHVSCKKNDL